MALQQSMILEAQEAIDNLQSCVSTQAGQLQEQGRAVSIQQQKLHALELASVGLKDEAHLSAQEASDVMADLMNMTKENQKLHEDIRLMEQKVFSLSSAAPWKGPSWVQHFFSLHSFFFMVFWKTRSHVFLWQI